MIRVVYFDAAGTLIKPARRVGDSYAAIAAKYGKAVSPADLFERFRVSFDHAPRLAFRDAEPNRVEHLERQWWKNLVAEVFEPWGEFADFDAYFDELFDYFAAPDAWSLFPEVNDTLTALQQRGVKLAVISNFDSRLIQILDGLGIAGSFTDIFVSSRVGYAKPERQIFDAALAKHGLAAAQALHVGDSEANDLEGARNAGLAARLIDRKPRPDLAPEDHITSLAQLIDCLD